MQQNLENRLFCSFPDPVLRFGWFHVPNGIPTAFQQKQRIYDMCVAGGHKRKRRQKREKGGCGSPYMITRKIHIMKQWSHTTRRRILNIYHVHTRVHDIVSLFGASGLGSNLIILRVCARAARAAQLCHALRPKLSKSETKVLQNFKPGTRMKRQMLQW